MLLSVTIYPVLLEINFNLYEKERTIPGTSNSRSRINNPATLWLDPVMVVEKHPQFSIVPFNVFIVMAIMKLKRKKDKTSADSRIKRPTIRNIPKNSSIHGRRKAK